MGTTHELTWGSLSIVRETMDPQSRRYTHHAPIVRLHAYTASEQARVIELDKQQLVQLLVDATSALSIIEQHERIEASANRGPL